MVFDILYIKRHGEDEQEIDLMGAPLSQRKDVLKSVINERPNSLEVVKTEECKNIK